MVVWFFHLNDDRTRQVQNITLCSGWDSQHDSYHKGAFNNYVDNMRGGGGQKMSVFVHAQGIKTVHAGGGRSKNGKILST